MSTKLFDLAENFVKFQRVFTENAAFQEQCIGRACSVPDFAEAVNTLVGIDANKGTRTWAGFHNSRNAKIWEMQAEDWDFVLRLNLRPTFLCTRAAVPHMMRHGHGRIVCMSSGAREGTPWTAYYQGGSAYSAAKAGVHGFVRDVALELAEHGINVNAVAPGPIDTERVGAGLRRLNETVEYSPNHRTPLRRLGQPLEVAHAYVTGHTLAVTGGR